MECLKPVVIEEVKQKAIKSTIEPNSTPFTSPYYIEDWNKIEKGKERNPVLNIL